MGSPDRTGAELIEVVARTELQKAAARIAEQEGIDTLASQVALTRRATRDLVNSGRVAPQSQDRLYTWYLRTCTDRITPGTVAVALALLFGSLPKEHRTRSQRALLRRLATIYRDAGAKTPDWLQLWESRLGTYEDPVVGPVLTGYVAVEFVFGAPLYMSDREIGPDPRRWVQEQIAEQGIWQYKVFYPWHQVARITFRT